MGELFEEAGRNAQSLVLTSFEVNSGDLSAVVIFMSR